MSLQNSSKDKLIKLARQLYLNAVSLNYGFVLWKFPGRRKPELFIGKIKKQKLSEITFPSFVIAPFQKHTDLVYTLEPFFYTHGKEWFILNTKSHTEETVKALKTASGMELNGNVVVDSGKIKDPHFLDIVNKAIQDIESEKLVKVVLSRQKQINLPEKFDPVDLFFRLTYTYRGAFVSFLSSKETGNWITASPELLLHSTKSRFRTVALAGTKPNPTNVGQFLIKDKSECRVVANHIRDLCKANNLNYDEDRLRVRSAGNVCHLEKRFYVERKGMSNSDIIKDLHPTPAICGTPIDQAYDFIVHHEEHPRGLYSGFIGPAYNKDNWHFYVNLRCMKFYNRQATLYAGAGIVKDSSPEDELKETEQKMLTLMNILTKP
jgi:isochorismate synthase